MKTKFLLIVGLLALMGVLVALKLVQFVPPPPFEFPPEVVGSYVAQQQEWEQQLLAVGSVRAVEGVRLRAELPGTVVRLPVESGSAVPRGALIAALDTSSEEAQLQSAQAGDRLAQVGLKRAKELRASATISEAEFDVALARAKEARARLREVEAIIEKKQIRAPFEGRLGLRQVSLGEYLMPGDSVASLQNLDQVHVDFSLPQKQVASVSPGYGVRVQTDAYPGESFEGQILAVEPDLDVQTRTVAVRAVFANPQGKLLPGMFVRVQVIRPERQSVVAIPATAVYSQSYGTLGYVIRQEGEGAAARKVVEERTLRLGEQRGDFVAVLEGIAAGEEVVATGVFKLSQGRAVHVDNTDALPYRLDTVGGNP